MKTQRERKLEFLVHWYRGYQAHHAMEEKEYWELERKIQAYRNEYAALTGRVLVERESPIKEKVEGAGA